MHVSLNCLNHSPNFPFLLPPPPIIFFLFSFSPMNSRQTVLSMSVAFRNLLVIHLWQIKPLFPMWLWNAIHLMLTMKWWCYLPQISWQAVFPTQHHPKSSDDLKWPHAVSDSYCMINGYLSSCLSPLIFMFAQLSLKKKTMHNLLINVVAGAPYTVYQPFGKCLEK